MRVATFAAYFRRSWAGSFLSRNLWTLARIVRCWTLISKYRLRFSRYSATGMRTANKLIYMWSSESISSANWMYKPYARSFYVPCSVGRHVLCLRYAPAFALENLRRPWWPAHTVSKGRLESRCRGTNLLDYFQFLTGANKSSMPIGQILIASSELGFFQ